MERDVDYYLSKGFERNMAEYYASGREIITNVEANEDFTLTIYFENGETRLYDMRPLLREGTVFEPLTEWDNFKRVYLDENHTVSWDIDPTVDSSKDWGNKVDLCPDVCYVNRTPKP